MANILLTNVCNQKCPYCFAAEQLKLKKVEMSFRDFKVVLNLLEKSGEKTIRLMGGEPTLHSNFKKFINYIFSHNLQPHLFTNGLFSGEIADFLTRKEDNIKYSFNINPPEMYSFKRWKTILKNFKKITTFKNSLIGAVIWQKDFNIDYLISLADEYPLRAILLRIANPIVGRSNKHIPLNHYSVLAKNLVREIKKTNENKIKIGFGCGLSKEMFNGGQLSILKKYRVANLNWGCDANSGRFDIGTDLSVFRCFPLSNWQRRKLTDFKNPREIENHFTQMMQRYQTDNSKIDFIHQGPCFSYLLSDKKHEQ